MTGFFEKKSISILFFLGLGLNLLALLTVFYFQTQVVNPDGVCYLSSANLFLKKDWLGAVHICPQAHWPFYSMLLAFTSALFHCDLIISAVLWQLIFLSFIYFGFLTLLKILGADHKTQRWGMALIIVSPILMHVRDNIIRDLGFWAFYLWAVCACIRYLERPQWRFVFSFCLLVFTASLFRIEGLFLWLAPIGILFLSRPFYLNIRMLLKIYSIPLLFMICMSFYFFKEPHSKWMAQLRWYDLWFQVHHGIQLLQSRFFVFSLPHENGLELLIFSLGAYGLWYVLCCISAASWLVSLFLFLAFRERVCQLTKTQVIGIAAFALIHFIMTFVFLIQNHFLSQRYLTPLILLAMLWIPFLLSQYAKASQSKLKKIAPYFLLCFLWGSFGVAILRSEVAIPLAGAFLKTKAPIVIYSNDLRVLYYAGISPTQIYDEKKYVWNELPAKLVLHKGEYLAWVLPKKQANALQWNSKIVLLKQFCHKRQCVNVYQSKGETK